MQNQNQNMSDLIESYLKNVLHKNETVEIRRSEIADQFNCVPSQINYVINTRFTIQQGYVVESKRGGGGYIRIMKVNLVDEMDILNELGNLIPEELSEREGNHLLQNLYENELITKREAQMMSLMMEKDTFLSNVKNAAEIRSNMMKKLIDNLKYS